MGAFIALRHSFAFGLRPTVALQASKDLPARSHVLDTTTHLVKTAAGQAFFYELPAPSNEDIAELNAKIAKRALRLFRKLAQDEEDYDSNLDVEADALACICAAAVQGRQALGSDAGKAAARLGREPNSQIISRRCTRYLGFSLHANVRVSGCSRSRLESLLRGPPRL